MLKLLAARLLNPDLKPLISAGYLSDNLELTDKGQRVLLTILFTEVNDVRAKMVKQAEEYLAQKKAEG